QDLLNALLLAAKTDRQIKGEQRGDCWESLLQISLKLAGT
ncbi:MAG: DNA polymerase III subunit delta, partial [Gammaproteobacteria bacterium]